MKPTPSGFPPLRAGGDCASSSSSMPSTARRAGGTTTTNAGDPLAFIGNMIDAAGAGVCAAIPLGVRASARNAYTQNRALFDSIAYLCPYPSVALEFLSTCQVTSTMRAACCLSARNCAILGAIIPIAGSLAALSGIGLGTVPIFAIGEAAIAVWLPIATGICQNRPPKIEDFVKLFAGMGAVVGSVGGLSSSEGDAFSKVKGLVDTAGPLVDKGVPLGEAVRLASDMLAGNQTAAATAAARLTGSLSLQRAASTTLPLTRLGEMSIATSLATAQADAAREAAKEQAKEQAKRQAKEQADREAAARGGSSSSSSGGLGGPLAGAAAGFLVGGPVGALVGAAGGFALTRGK